MEVWLHLAHLAPDVPDGWSFADVLVCAQKPLGLVWHPTMTRFWGFVTPDVAAMLYLQRELSQSTVPFQSIWQGP